MGELRWLRVRPLPCRALLLIVQLLFVSHTVAEPSLSDKTHTVGGGQYQFQSVLGDPGMRDDRVRVALEAWNFCNKVGAEGPGLPSPRQADCSDMQCTSKSGQCVAIQHVTEQDNTLKAGDAFPEGSFEDFEDPDQYAIEKELYLASRCQLERPGVGPWHFWMIMLKNGNFDLGSGLCPSTALTSKLVRTFTKFVPVMKGSFPCFDKGCMNQPQVYHNWSTLAIPCNADDSHNCTTQPESLSGSFYGTYDLGSSIENSSQALSYFSVKWEKNLATGSWLFHHVLKVNRKYPWLMLYLRADATKGLSGGYPYETRGMIAKVPESPSFKVVLTLNVTKGGGPESQFYLLDIGGCWKNTGEQCDGNTTTDVTRYSEMIINPSTASWCRPSDISQCPPYHISTSGEIIYRNDTARFPYSAYHLYCAPANAQFVERPFHYCDPYSNPQPQELVQLLPHPEWAVHGYPARKGEGWVGDPRTWELDVGSLSSRLYFYQDPGTKPARRLWPSIDVGTEIYISAAEELAEWTVSDFDVLVPKKGST